MSVAFEALSQLGSLVNVDFTNNYNLKGSWTGNTTYSTMVSQPLRVEFKLVTRENVGLRVVLR